MRIQSRLVSLLIISFQESLIGTTPICYSFATPLSSPTLKEKISGPASIKTCNQSFLLPPSVFTSNVLSTLFQAKIKSTPKSSMDALLRQAYATLSFERERERVGSSSRTGTRRIRQKSLSLSHLSPSVSFLPPPSANPSLQLQRMRCKFQK